MLWPVLPNNRNLLLTQPLQKLDQLSPDALAKLVRTSGWQFDRAVVSHNGKTCRVIDLYADAMALLRPGSTEAKQQACELFAAILAEAPQFAEAHFQLARLRFEADDRDAALRFSANAAAMLPDNINYHVLYVAALAVAGRIADAAAEVRAYAGRNPRDMLALDLLWSDEQVVLACLDTHLVLILPGRIFFNGQLRPLESVVDDCLVELRAAGGMLGSAAGRGLRSLVERHPGCEEARFWFAELLRRDGRIEEVMTLCAAGERIRAMGWPIWLVYGVAFAETGNLDRALACFEEAAMINDSLPIYSPNNLTKADANLLARWYADILNSLIVAPGAYSRPWRYPDFPEFVLPRPDRRVPDHRLRQTIDDIIRSIDLTSAWWALARNDVTARYRRTFLGPWWTVLGTGIALLGMTTVWSLIFHMTASEFFPYLTSGYAIWMLITSTLTEGCASFTDGTAQAIQRSMDLPRFIHVLRLVARNILLFLHTLMIFVAGTIFFGVNLTPSTLLVLPGLILLILNLLWVGTLFGIAGARYRDLAPAIGAFLTVIFFVTPVIWKSEMLGGHAYISHWNPIAQLIAIVRDPLLGFAPPVFAWQTAIGLCMVGWPLAILVYARTRDRIVFWL
jgi:ABC-type polysaccharide/polyol phosphate export permease/tetratricopeptide (TPR) repeat protein